MANFPILQEAIDLVTKAVAEDRNRNYEEAGRLYYDSVDLFHQAIKYESRTEKVRGMIRGKCSQYVDRSTKIKEYLKSLKPNQSEDVKLKEGCSENEEDSEPLLPEGEEEEKLFQRKLEKALFAKTSNVKWWDIVGVEDAKHALKEGVILPLKFPQLFPKEMSLWGRSILLVGPPGSGKSYLAKALAAETRNAHFFSATASDLLSQKASCESDQLIRILFNVARRHKPSIIFIDEIDSLCAPPSDNECTNLIKRIMAELSAQMRNIEEEKEGLFLLGATNNPGRLDVLVRRHFKEIHLPLPSPEERCNMFKLMLEEADHKLVEDDFKTLSLKSDGWSGGDIQNVVREALMEPHRKVQEAKHFRRVKGLSNSYSKVIVDDLLTPCLPECPGAIRMGWEDVPKGKLYEPPLTMRDMLKSLTASNANAPHENKI